MFYDVIGYRNTGFNSVDIPANASVLNNAQSINFGSISLVQNRGLSEIRVTASFDQVKDVDYLNIGGVYYTLTEYPAMLNENTCRFTITEDFITSLGGITNDDFITGIVNYAHVPSDNMFEWTAKEDRWSPSQELNIEYELLGGDDTTSYSFVNTTLNLISSGTTRVATVYDGVGITEGSNVSVAVPNVEANVKKTEVGFYTFSQGLATTETPGYVTYLYKNAGAVSFQGDIQEMLGQIRKLGLQDAILAQYKVPKFYVNPEQLEYVVESSATGDPKICTVVTKLVPIFTSKRPLKDLMNFKYNNGYICKNNRAYSGEWNAYTLHAMASGESVTLNPEYIYEPSDNFGISPIFIITADLRAGGTPIAYPQYYKGNLNNLMFNNIKGLEWENATTTFTGKQGRALDIFNYKAEAEVSSWGDLTKQLGNTTGFISNGMQALNDEGGSKPIQGMIRNVGGFIDTAVRRSYRREIGANKLYQNSYVVAPTISFPRNESLRDFVGNGMMVSRIYLSKADLQAYDNFMTVYGYPVGKEIHEANFISNRQYFNYLSLSDVSIKKNGFSMMEREGLAEQVSNCRLWKVLPSSWNISLGNPIV